MNKATLYYGGGECSIEGHNIIAVHIYYSGVVEVFDKSPKGYEMFVQNNQIMTVRLSSSISLKYLFHYEGDFKITRVIAINSRHERVPTAKKAILDYSNLLYTKAEDLTFKSEEIKTSYKTKKVYKTMTNTPIIEDLSTPNHDGDLYLRSGELYNGFFHIHKYTGKTMTGKTHNNDSENLYIKSISGKNAGKLIEPLFENLKRSNRISTHSGGSAKKRGY